MDVYEEKNATVVGVQQVDPSQVDKYGIIQPGITEGGLHELKDMVEKAGGCGSSLEPGNFGTLCFEPGHF